MPDGSKGAARGAVAIIPARFASARFPGKVLADKTGMPLIVHVCWAAAGAASLSRVLVATDDERVRSAVVAAGFEAVMTSPDHPNGTSRVAEAARLIGLADNALVVNVQGDEPELAPPVIDAAVGALADGERAFGASIATAAAPIASREEFLNPNVVKVVVGHAGRALYFSRSPIPFDRDASASPPPAPPAGDGFSSSLRHIGLYVYRRRFLEEYAAMPPTPLEQLEKLEQLRAMEHGRSIAVAVVDAPGRAEGIDTPEQYERFVERWRS